MGKMSKNRYYLTIGLVSRKENTLYFLSSLERKYENDKVRKREIGDKEADCTGILETL